MRTIACLFSFVLLSAAAMAQNRNVSTEYLTDDAILVFDARPGELRDKPISRLLPTEIIEAWSRKTIGIPAEAVASIRVVAPMLTGPQPNVGVAINFDRDVSIDNLKDDLLVDRQSVTVAGRSCYRIDGPPGTVLHVVSNRHWVVASEGFLDAFLTAGEGDSRGRLAAIAATVARQGDLQFIVDLEPIRPILAMNLAGAAAQLPPAMARLPELVNKFDAAWTHVDLASMNLMTYGDWTLRATDDVAADDVEEILKQSIEGARAMLVAAGRNAVAGNDEVAEATRRYIERVSFELAGMIDFRRDGNLFRSPAVEAQDIAVTGVLVGLLLPAVQAAREAARRMSASNHLRQIGLALHNHHAAYRALPAQAICDDAGEPLLSWRVKILPFIEEQQLYEQFKLDEPWDSPHNRKLISQMPETFVDPSAVLPAGSTVFQAISRADGIMPAGCEPTRFRDVRDGTSNTIMVVEASTDHAVPWTKPADLEPNPQDPLAKTGNVHPGGFHVLMGDGSVRFITYSIDETLFKALLTPNGKEPIGSIP